MTEITIPDEAQAAATAAIHRADAESDWVSASADKSARAALAAAAPLIVAAELERLADEGKALADSHGARAAQRQRVVEEAGDDPDDDPACQSLLGATSAHLISAERLRSRAVELRAQAPTAEDAR